MPAVSAANTWRDRVLLTLWDAEGSPMTLASLYARCQADDVNERMYVRRALMRLVRTGEVHRCKRGTYAALPPGGVPYVRR